MYKFEKKSVPSGLNRGDLWERGEERNFGVLGLLIELGKAGGCPG